MNEELEKKEEEQLVDDGKIHFPKAGPIIIGVLLLLMIICVILIFVFRGMSNGN